MLESITLLSSTSTLDLKDERYLASTTLSKVIGSPALSGSLATRAKIDPRDPKVVETPSQQQMDVYMQ
jgi:hypothetical protein